MTRDSRKKPSQREVEAIAAAYRSAVERGDVEEIERLDAMIALVTENRVVGRI